MMKRTVSHIHSWLDERLGGDGAVKRFLSHKTVPLHRHTFWYYLGGMSLFLFVIQVLTGMLLILYYRASPEDAFESVQHIETQVHFGWLIRSIHSWGANLMVFCVFAHMFSVYFLKAYRKPRELTWFSGMILLFLVLGFGFTGYLLPWNTLAFFATKVGTDMASVVPVLGDFLLRFLRGGTEVSGATLTRFFAFHVAILPAMVTLFLGFHLFLVQKQGMSVPPDVEKAAAEGRNPRRDMPFFPNFLLRDMIGWFAALGILGALAALFPWELGTKADPFAPAPAGIRPEWYFLSVFQTLKMLPAKILSLDGEVVGFLAISLASVAWLMVPFLDPAPTKQRWSRFFNGLGVFIIAYIVVTSLISWLG